MRLLRLLLFPVSILALSIYHGLSGNFLASALAGAVFVMLAIYILFPASNFTMAAFADLSGQIRVDESRRAFHLRCAAYWCIPVSFCMLIVFGGAYLADQFSFLTNSAVFGAVVFFTAPLLGVVCLLKVFGQLFDAARSS